MLLFLLLIYTFTRSDQFGHKKWLSMPNATVTIDAILYLIHAAVTVIKE